MSRAKGPVRAKDLKVYPIEDYPYQITKPDLERSGAGPIYKASLLAATSHIIDELVALRDVLKQYDSEVEPIVDRVIAKAGKIGEEGGTIDELVDPYTKIRYRATIVKRVRV